MSSGSSGSSAPARVLIAGCGYLGLEVARAFRAAGSDVWGLRRSSEAGARLSAEGVHFLQADLLDPEALKRLSNLPLFDRVVFCQAPSGDADDYASVYVQATRNLTAALGSSNARRTVFVSSTSVYADSGGAVVDESTPTDVTRERSGLLVEAERAALAGSGSVSILRLAGLYGPGRHAMKRYAKVRPPALQIMNRIHVADAAAAVVTLLERGKNGEIYIGVDDEPVEARVFLEWLSRESGVSFAVERPEPGAGISGKTLTNRKLRSLGWRPRYPSFREGYSEILRAEKAAGAPAGGKPSRPA